MRSGYQWCCNSIFSHGKDLSIQQPWQQIELKGQHVSTVSIEKLSLWSDVQAGRRWERWMSKGGSWAWGGAGVRRRSRICAAVAVAVLLYQQSLLWRQFQLERIPSRWQWTRLSGFFGRGQPYTCNSVACMAAILYKTIQNRTKPHTALQRPPAFWCLFLNLHLL